MELADPAHAGTQFVRDYKRGFTEILRGFVEESVGRSAPKLVPMIALLVEGAIVTAVMHGTPDAALKLAEEAEGVEPLHFFRLYNTDLSVFRKVVTRP